MVSGCAPKATVTRGRVPRSSQMQSTSRRSTWCGDSLRSKYRGSSARSTTAIVPGGLPVLIASMKITQSLASIVGQQLHSPRPAVHQRDVLGQLPALPEAVHDPQPEPVVAHDRAAERR